jgi:plasmid stabilization system protein ParE
LELKWSENAENDVLSIVSYIKENSGPLSAAKIYERIKARVIPLKDFPGTGRVSPELAAMGIASIQQILEKPWIIYYTVTDTVDILAVIDGRRQLSDVLYQKLIEGKLA